MKTGDLFYTSWGYDQTNYDYIVILSISDTGKTALCQRAKHTNIGNDGYGSDLQKPISEGYGDIFRMRIDGKYLRGSYPYCHDAVGPKRLDSFSPCTANDVFAETDCYHGH